MNSSYITELPGDATANQVIDVLNYFTADAWNQLADAMPSISNVIANVHQQVAGINNFAFGINVAQAPGFRLSIYLLIPICAALFQFLSTKTMKQPDMGKDNPAAGMTKSMSIMMPLMSFYFCLVAPAGMGLYWATSALFMCIQQIVVNKYMEHADIEKMIEKNRKKAAKKKAKGKKTLMERLTGAAGEADGSGQQSASGRTITDVATMNLKKMPGGSKNAADVQNVDIDKLGEIGKKAYLVSQYEKKQNTGGGKK